MEIMVTSGPFTRALARIGAIALVLASFASCGKNPIDPANELPFGNLDVPKPGETLPSAKVSVAGWALDDSAVAHVRVFIDGRFKGVTTLAVPRPDVVQAYPRYGSRGNVCGWTLVVDVGTPGPHKILAQAVDDFGATRDLGVVDVMIAK
jgi:hypothetical protein